MLNEIIFKKCFPPEVGWSYFCINIRGIMIKLFIFEEDALTNQRLAVSFKNIDNVKHSCDVDFNQGFLK